MIYKAVLVVIVCYAVVVFVGLRYISILGIGSNDGKVIERVSERESLQEQQQNLAQLRYEQDLMNEFAEDSFGANDDDSDKPINHHQEPLFDRNGFKIVYGQAELKGPFGDDALHGVLGQKPDGSPGYIPKPKPSRRPTAEDVAHNGFFR